MFYQKIFKNLFVLSFFLEFFYPEPDVWGCSIKHAIFKISQISIKIYMPEFLF